MKQLSLGLIIIKLNENDTTVILVAYINRNYDES